MLGIDTATRRGNLALGRLADSGTLLGGVHLRCYDGALDHAERLLGELSALTREAGIEFSEIEALAVGVGPGSFTGVRVGASTAKALAFLGKTRVVAVGSLEAMARAYEGPEGLRLSVLDARRDELFVGAYGADGREVTPPVHLHRDALGAWLAPLPGGGVVLGEVDAPALAGLARHRSPDTDLPGARALIELGAARLGLGALVPIEALEPAYLRPPDAALPKAPLLPHREPRLDSPPHGRPGRIRARATAGTVRQELRRR